MNKRTQLFVAMATLLLLLCSAQHPAVVLGQDSFVGHPAAQRVGPDRLYLLRG